MNFVGDIVILDGTEQRLSSQIGYSAAGLNEDLYLREFNEPEGTVMCDRNELGPEVDIATAARGLLRGRL